MGDQCSCCEDLVPRVEMTVCHRCGCYACADCTEGVGAEVWCAGCRENEYVPDDDCEDIE